MVGVGLQIVHLGTVLFVSGQVERASATYGPLGVAFTILVWLFVVSRVVVGSAMLNATVWRRHEPDSSPQRARIAAARSQHATPADGAPRSPTAAVGHEPARGGDTG